MSDIFPIVTIPAPSLRERSIEVDKKEITTPKFQAFLDKLTKTMGIADGVGIAAPQVGINKRIFIANIGHETRTFINPIFTKQSDSLVETEEGCLSVPGIFGMVNRPKKITIQFIDRHGRQAEMILKNFDAVVAQHETDHLDGILFIDKVTDFTRGQLPISS